MNAILDEAKRGEICGIVAVGGTYKLAAQYVGCTRHTIRNTANRDPAFQERLEKAKASPEVNFLYTVKEAGKEKRYWQAAKWALQFIRPERYRRGPRTMALDEVKDLVSQLVQAIVKVVPDSGTRAAIRLQIRLVTGETIRKVKERHLVKKA